MLDPITKAVATEAVARALLDLDEAGLDGIAPKFTWENTTARQRAYYTEAAEVALAIATPIIEAAMNTGDKPD